MCDRPGTLLHPASRGHGCAGSSSAVIGGQEGVYPIDAPVLQDHSLTPRGNLATNQANVHVFHCGKKESTRRTRYAPPPLINSVEMFMTQQQLTA